MRHLSGCRVKKRGAYLPAGGYQVGEDKEGDV